MANVHGMRVMVLALVSLMLLLSGLTAANAVPRFGASVAAQAECVSGGLLATGLVLIGIGLHISFGS